MKKNKIIIGMLFLILALTTCKKEDGIEKETIDVKYVGEWESTYTEIAISSDGKGIYYYSDGFLTKTINGNVTIENNNIIFKGSGISQTLHIDLDPKQIQVDFDAYNTYMILDGKIFYKKSINNINYEYTCQDGIQNFGESGIDCGGMCSSCPEEPSCDDNIMNGDETGIDCGGSCIACEAPCAESCIDSIFYLTYTPSGNIYEKQITNIFYNSSYSPHEFTINMDSWELHIYLPQPPNENWILPIQNNYYDVENNSDFSSMKLIPTSPGSSTLISNGGNIYISVENEVLTLTFCDVIFPDFSASGRITYSLQ